MRKINLAGKIIIVTGASSGIGRAIALQLGGLGSTVVLTARRKGLLDEVATKIRSAGGRALVVPADLCQMDEIANIVSQTVKEFGRIDALINVAGVGWYDWIEEISSTELQQQFQTNVIGMAELIRQVVPLMKQQRSGEIVNFSSYASRLAVPPLTIYASTKYAIEGLTEGLRRELANWNIDVMRVHPWAVATEFNKRAASHMGIIFPASSFAPLLKMSQVTPEKVASEVIKALIHPRPSIYISKWRVVIEAIVLINHYLPGIVDRFIRSDVKKMWYIDGQHDLKAHASGISKVSGPSSV